MTPCHNHACALTRCFLLLLTLLHFFFEVFCLLKLCLFTVCIAFESFTVCFLFCPFLITSIPVWAVFAFFDIKKINHARVFILLFFFTSVQIFMDCQMPCLALMHSCVFIKFWIYVNTLDKKSRKIMLFFNSSSSFCRGVMQPIALRILFRLY